MAPFQEANIPPVLQWPARCRHIPAAAEPLSLSFPIKLKPWCNPVPRCWQAAYCGTFWPLIGVGQPIKPTYGKLRVPQGAVGCPDLNSATSPCPEAMSWGIQRAHQCLHIGAHFCLGRGDSKDPTRCPRAFRRDGLLEGVHLKVR